MERQYLETLTASGEQFEELTVDGTSIEAYMRNWTWDYARYQHQGKKLSELVQQILSMTGQMDEELKKLTTAHSEKAQLLAALDRKKNVNLSVSEFEDFLTPEMVARLDVSDDEHLRTVFVAMPRSSEAEFLREYVNIGLSIGIEFQGEKLPVVAPGSAKLVLASGEQVMYTLTVLKGKHEAGFYEQAAAAAGGGGGGAGGGGAPLSADAAAAAAAAAAAGAFVAGKSVDFIEPLKNKFRERRMIFRTFAYDEKKSGGVEGQVDKAKSDVLESHVNLLRWCKVHFSMIFPALIHLKVISSFVESVLRYGVPVNFLAVFLDPNLKREKELKKQLVDTILHLRPELKDARGNFDKDEEGQCCTLRAADFFCPFADHLSPRHTRTQRTKTWTACRS